MTKEEWHYRRPVAPGERPTLHYNDHPLRCLFWQKGFTTSAGMNWLQERGHISDECVTPEDVAQCDAERVLTLAGWPSWRIANAFNDLTPRHLICGPWPGKAPYLVPPNMDSRNERYSRFDQESHLDYPH